MSYLFDKLGEFEDETLYYDISKKFFECGLAYEKINSYYMKLYYKKTNIKQNLRILSNKILEIQKNEILIYDML